MEDITREFIEAKQIVFNFYDVMTPHIVSEKIKKHLLSYKDMIVKDPKNIEEIYSSFEHLTYMFEYMQIMKNNEKYVQESAGASPSVYAVNTNIIQKNLDHLSSNIFKYIKWNKQSKNDDGLMNIINELETTNKDNVHDVIKELVPGSYDDIGKPNISMMKLDYTPIEENDIPKNGLKIKLDIKNVTNMLYDFGSLVDEMKVKSYKSNSDEGMNENILNRFHNFKEYKPVEREDIISAIVLEDDMKDKDLYLLLGVNDGKTYFRRVLHFPDWDIISKSDHLPMNMFKTNLENKRFMMYKNNIKAPLTNKWLTKEKYGLIKNEVRTNKRSKIPDVVFGIAKKDVKNDSQLLNLISVIDRMNSDKSTRRKEEYISSMRNFQELNTVFQ